MATQFGGLPDRAENNLPTSKNISSTTNATPIVITTSAAHGIKPGEYFVVVGADDPALNGMHLLAGAITSTTLEALEAPFGTDVAGTLAGGANGTVLSLGFGSTYAIPSDLPGNPRNAASVNVGLEALGDRTAYLLYLVQWAQHVVASGFLTIDDGGTFRVATGGLARWDNGGEAAFNSGALLRIKSGGTHSIEAGGIDTNASVLGVQFTGAQPAKTANPGANNIAIGTNQCKAWGCVAVGSDAATLNDGFNVATVSVDGGTDEVIVTFARAMANDDYAVTFGVEDDATNVPIPLINGTKTTGGFHFNLWKSADGSLIVLSGASSRKVSFHVMARQ